MRGFKFHNGQIVGDLETRPTDKDHVKDYYAFEVRPDRIGYFRIAVIHGRIPQSRHSADDRRTDDADSNPFRII